MCHPSAVRISQNTGSLLDPLSYTKASKIWVNTELRQREMLKLLLLCSAWGNEQAKGRARNISCQQGNAVTLGWTLWMGAM